MFERFLSLSFLTLCSLLGVDKVIQYAVTEWLTDIRKNQLPGILGGVGPMHSVVQLCELILIHTHCCTPCQSNIYMFTCFTLSLFISPFSFSSPRSEGSVLVAHRAVQEGWTHYSRSPEGGSILWHLHSIGCSGAQQQAGAGHTGTQSVHQSYTRARCGPWVIWDNLLKYLRIGSHCWCLSASSLTGHGRDGLRHPVSNSPPEPLRHHRGPSPPQQAPQSCSAGRPPRGCGQGLRHRQRGASPN